MWFENLVQDQIKVLENRLGGEGDKDDAADVRDEMTKLRNRCGQYEETVKQLEADLKSMTDTAGT